MFIENIDPAALSETIIILAKLIVQIAIFSFTVGVSIFALRYTALRQEAEKGGQSDKGYFLLSKLEKVEKKIVNLFYCSIAIIFFAFIFITLVNQFNLAILLLIFFLSLEFILTGIFFYYFYVLIGEIIRRDTKDKKQKSKTDSSSATG